MFRRLRTERGPCRIRIARFAQAKLALAVIAEPARLQDRRRADHTQRLVQLFARVHRHEIRGRQAAFAEQGFLGQSVLRHGQRLRRGEDRDPLGQPVRRLGRHVLEIEGDHVDPRGKPLQGGVVGPVGYHQRCDLPCAGIGGAVHHQGPHAQRRRRQRQHARQLATTEYAQHGLPSFAH